MAWHTLTHDASTSGLGTLPRRRQGPLALVLLLLCVLADALHAQDYLTATGAPTFSTIRSVELGYVNLANGNLHQEIPLGSFPQRGSRGYLAALVYDSRIWKIVQVGASFAWQPTNVQNSSGGWRFISSASEGNVTFKAVSTVGPPPRSCITTKYNNFTWTDPFGTPHLFPGQTTQVSSGCGAGSSTAGGLAVDSSGHKMAITNYTVATVWAPDGTQVYPSVKDANGNYFSKDPNGNIIDTLGRTPVTVITNCNGNSNQTCYDILNSQGATSRVTVTTASISVNTAFGQSGVTEYSGTLTVIHSITLPDQTSYTFSYDSGTTPAHYGSLTNITLPTLGQIAYAYTTYQDSFGNRNLWVNSRTSGGGTWTYTPAVITTCASGSVNCQQKVTLATPSNNQTVYTFTLNNGAWGSQVQSYSGLASGGNLLSTVTTNYDLTQPCATPGCTGNQYVRAVTRTVTLPVPNSQSITNKTEYSYDTPQNGNLTAVKEWRYVSGTFPPSPDRETDFTYLATSTYTAKNIINRPLSKTVKDSAGTVVAQTDFSYDDAGTLLDSTPPSGIAHHDDTNYGIMATVRGNLTKLQRCTVLTACGTNYVQTALTYDTTGQVLSVQDPRGNLTTFSYGDNFFNDNGANPPQPFTPSAPTNAYLTSVTRPLIGAATNAYYFSTGRRASSTDQNGANSFSHFLDSLDRLTHTYGPVLPGGSRPWTLTVYPPNSQTQVDAYVGITDSVPSAGCSSCSQDRAILDSLGRVITQTLMSDPEGATSVTTTYDSSGRVLNVSHPARTIPSTTDGVETPTYDGLGRVTKLTHQDNSYSQTFYGAAVGGTGLGGLTSQLCSSATYGLGYPALVIDEAGKKREIWIDGFGRTIEADEPDSAGNLTSATCYKYDALGNLIQVVQGSQTRTYAYDPLSRATSVSIPEISNAQGQQCPVTYTYDNNGNVLTKTAPAPNQSNCTPTVTTTFSYDALNRLTGKTYSDNTPPVTYFYDQTSYNGLTITNGKGRTTGMSDASGATAWSYDAAGNILTEARTIAGVTKTISYSYSLDGSINTVTYPSGRQVVYTVSNAQRLTSAKDVASGTQYAITASYAPPGGLQSVITGKINGGGFAGITETRSYNNRLEYTTTQASSTAGTALNLSFSYNLPGGNNGSVASITNNVDSGRSVNFQYDPLNRIGSASSQATSGPNCWGQGFTQDPVANLTQISITQCSGNPLSLTVNANNHITNSGFSYDAVGNMTQDGSGYTYAFDAENRVVQASGMSGGPYCYVYDGDGVRVAKKSNATTCNQGTVAKLYWRSLSGDTLAETDSTGSTANAAYSEYIFFAGRRIARQTGTGSVYYYFADHLGTTRTITDAQGNICYDAEFTPYGQEMQRTDTCPQSYKFTGYERDSETGLDYAIARYYSPRLGRFLSPDPLGGTTGDPQSINPYSYVRNSPTALVDPLGLWPEPRDPPDEPRFRDVVTPNSGGPACYINGFRSSCGLVSYFAQHGLAGVCLDARCTLIATLETTLGGYYVTVLVGYAVPAYPCPWGDCQVSPSWVEYYVPIRIGWIAAPSGKDGGNAYIREIARQFRPLNKLSDCSGQAIANQVPFGDDIFGTPEGPADPVGTGLGAADWLADPKNAGRVAWWLYIIGLPELSQASGKGLAKTAGWLAPFAGKISVAGWLWSGGSVVYGTYSCYNKPD